MSGLEKSQPCEDEFVLPKEEDLSSTENESDLELGELETGPGKRHPRSRNNENEGQSMQSPDSEEGKAVTQKSGRKMLLLVSLLGLVTAIDSTNIGYAKIAGVDIDLDINSDGLEMVIVIFYMGYIFCQWIGIFWGIIPAHLFFTLIAAIWGLFASLQSISTSVDQLLWLRAILGITTAAVSSMPVYLALKFRREELGNQIGIFFAMVPFITSFASLLALAIVKIGNALPIAPWRLLFLLEGFPSIILAVLAWNNLPNDLSTPTLLKMRERDNTSSRTGGHSMASPDIKYDLKSNIGALVKILLDVKTYMAAAMLFLTNLTFTSMPTFIMTRKTMSFSAMPSFLPTIVHEFGYSIVTSHILCAPPYLLSSFMVIYTMRRSDTDRRRGYYICVHALISTIGYAFIALGGYQGWPTWLLYFAIYPASMGHFSILALIITWALDNQNSHFQRIMSFVIIQSIGQFALPFAPRLYPESDDPFYTKAMCVCAGSMSLIAVIATCLRFYLSRKNKHNVLGGRHLLSKEQAGFLTSSETAIGREFML